MPHSLLVVEGAHDAAFFGHLLVGRGYSKAEVLNDVPAFWDSMIPRRYPLDGGGRLDRVIRFPDVYSDPAGNTVGISVAGGEDNIEVALRTTVEQLGAQNFAGIGIVVDADYAVLPPQRFESLIQRLQAMNTDAVAEKVPGFPLPLPNGTAVVAPGPPRVAVHLFPDNLNQGLLETVLLACANIEYPRIQRAANLAVRYLDYRTPAGDQSLRKLRRASGPPKAEAGIIANVLQPGVSLAVALMSSGWLQGAALAHPNVQLADQFLQSIL